MENQDKIFEQFKEVAREAESKEFPAMDKVWSRVEGKLDYKAARKSAGIWRFVAIAASILLLVAVGFQLFNSERIPENRTTEIITAPNIPSVEDSVISPIRPTPKSEITSIDRTPQKPKQTIFKNPVIVERTIADTVTIAAVWENPTIEAPTQIETSSAEPLQTISGFVTDETGSLPGANVVVMGTTRGTHTDIDGKYVIEAKEGEKLVFSFIGMKDIVATVGDKNQINAKLPEGNTTLESVVVNASAVKTKKANTYAGKSVKILKAPSTSTVRESDSRELERSGTVDFTSNAPTLYIIDGKPATEYEFKMLKTEEIASMKLLSQTEAKTLYGKKAVNGAMVVSKKAAKNAEAEEFDEARFENVFENPAAAPLSTFNLAVETGSYTEIRNYINKGKKVPASAVRIEEMINYFEYKYPQPEQNPVGIYTEYGSCPWNSKNKLLKIGIQGKNAATAIAKDAKIQIEFNPSIVKAYRLIGYDKRKLQPEDFKNSNLHGRILGGQTVTALYEIIPNGVESQYFEDVDESVFTKINTGTTFGGELANIKFRFENTETGKPAEIAKRIQNKPELLQNTSPDFRFCAAVAWFGLKLRQSDLIGNRSYTELLKLAKGSVSADSEGSRGEFIRLVEAVK